LGGAGTGGRRGCLTATSGGGTAIP
jgi:hypothetical protein